MKLKMNIAFVAALLILSVIGISFNTPPPAEQKYQVSMTLDKWQFVLAAIQEKPMKEAAPVFGEMYNQLQAQVSDTTKTKK